MNRHAIFLASLVLTACSGVENPDGEDNENEVISTITLTFAPAAGDPLVFAWTDPENDGSPVIDPIVLADADDYTLSVAFTNDLAEPPEDITAEIDAESDEHQLFFTGTAVSGPAGVGAAAVLTHAYADTDADGAPVGLVNNVVTTGTGTGTLIVTLRHLPPQNDTPVKTSTLAEDVATGGIAALPGASDAQVTFDLSVE
jgi:hypothetical protein